MEAQSVPRVLKRRFGTRKGSRFSFQYTKLLRTGNKYYYSKLEKGLWAKMRLRISLIFIYYFSSINMAIFFSVYGVN